MFDFFIIATPIGNYDDISLRALNILKNIDFVVCEEEREYKKLFSILKINEKKYILCNEHNESDAIDIVIPLIKKGEKGALISDCGTPLFEDPGFKLVESIRKNNFKLTSIPGANSLILALSLSPFKIKNFYYNGFLPKKTEERDKEITKILTRDETIILIESPYRLKNIIELLKKNISARKIAIFYNLTMNDEKVIWGSPIEVEKEVFRQDLNKGEFLIVIEQRTKKVKK